MKSFNKMEEIKMSGVNGGTVMAAVAAGFSLAAGAALGSTLAVVKNKDKLGK